MFRLARPAAGGKSVPGRPGCAWKTNAIPQHDWETERDMGILVPIGTALTVTGLIGLIACILMVMRARKKEPDEEALKARLQKVVAVNLGALALSGIGLMLVITGIFLT